MWQGTYHATPYFVSKVFVEIPMAILTSLLIYLITYWLLGIQGKCRPYPPRTDRGGSDRTTEIIMAAAQSAIRLFGRSSRSKAIYVCIVLNPQPDRSMRREHCALRRR